MQNQLTHRLWIRSFSRLSATALLALALGLVAGCGGGSDSASGATTTGAGTTTGTGTGTTTTPTVTAASIQLLTSSPQMPSSGTSTVDLTAIVLSSTKQAVSGRTVTFTTNPLTDSAFVNNISASGVSDANGLVTAKLNLGANKANRTISLTAAADSATANNSVDVAGTAITVSGNSSLAFGASTTLLIHFEN